MTAAKTAEEAFGPRHGLQTKIDFSRQVIRLAAEVDAVLAADNELAFNYGRLGDWIRGDVENNDGSELRFHLMQCNFLREERDELSGWSEAMPDIDEGLWNQIPNMQEFAKTLHPKAVHMRAHLIHETTGKALVQATPYEWVDPATLKRREWLYAYSHIRNFVSLVVAPGAAGKSALMNAEALSLVTGRSLLGMPVHGGPHRVWLWNLEDPLDELRRRIAATCLHFGITSADIDDRLYLNSGRDDGLCLASQDRNGIEVLEPIVSELVAEIKMRDIDILIVDPFVSSHAVSENDNGAIDAVVKAWGRVADQAGCAIVLVHHLRKLGGEQASAESARGASSLVAAARSVRVLQRMTQKEAEGAGLESHKGYFQVFDDKNNLAPADENATWFRMVSVPLPNGDNVGVVEPWTYPRAFAGVSTADLIAVQQAVAGKGFRQSSQAKDWAGYAVGEVLGLDMSVTANRKRVSIMIKTWIANGVLDAVELPDKDRKLRPCVDVGEWAE